MTDRDVLLETIGAIAARVVGSRRALRAELAADTPLAEGGWWLDSLELLEVIVACEAEFDIIFEPGQDLVGGALETVGTLAALIHGKNPRLSRAPSAVVDS